MFFFKWSLVLFYKRRCDASENGKRDNLIVFVSFPTVEWPERGVVTNPYNDWDQLSQSVSRFLRCTKAKRHLLHILLWDTWVAADVRTEESQTNTNNHKQHDFGTWKWNGLYDFHTVY